MASEAMLPSFSLHTTGVHSVSGTGVPGTADTSLLSPSCAAVHKRMLETDDRLSLDAIDLIIDVISRYSVKSLAFSFNGGKDCVVLLHLLRVAFWLLSTTRVKLHTDSHSISSTTSTATKTAAELSHAKCDMQQTTDSTVSASQLPVLWFQKDDEFPELISFCFSQTERYGFKVHKLCGDFRSGLESFCGRFSECRGVLMGQRHDDPYCHWLSAEAPCSEGWPSVTRMNPLIAWNYDDVWRFLDGYRVPVCALYEFGYTSLGDCHFSIANPLLYDCATDGWQHARRLQPHSAERFGRIFKPKSKEASARIRQFMFAVRKLEDLSFYDLKSQRFADCKALKRAKELALIHSRMEQLTTHTTAIGSDDVVAVVPELDTSDEADISEEAKDILSPLKCAIYKKRVLKTDARIDTAFAEEKNIEEEEDVGRGEDEGECELSEGKSESSDCVDTSDESESAAASGGLPVNVFLRGTLTQWNAATQKRIRQGIVAALSQEVAVNVVIDTDLDKLQKLIAISRETALTLQIL